MFGSLPQTFPSFSSPLRTPRYVFISRCAYPLCVPTLLETSRPILRDLVRKRWNQVDCKPRPTEPPVHEPLLSDTQGTSWRAKSPHIPYLLFSNKKKRPPVSVGTRGIPQLVAGTRSKWSKVLVGAGWLHCCFYRGLYRFPKVPLSYWRRSVTLFRFYYP